MKIDNLGINQFRYSTKGLSQAVVDVKVHKILFHDNFVILILSFILVYFLNPKTNNKSESTN
jgi:hypothetical protein